MNIDIKKYCNCIKCISCCNCIPGVPIHDDVIKIAKFLDISITNCLKNFFIVGYREDIELLQSNGRKKTYENILFVYPARVGYNNRFESFVYPLIDGKCIFLKENKCIIHDVKPYECLNTFGCEKRNELPRSIALMDWDKQWKEDTINIEIKKFISEKIKEGGKNDKVCGGALFGWH